MWRLHLRDELEGAERLMFEPRPVEELYDTEADPHEINNLADDPAHKPELDRLRDALDEWRDEVGDLGDMPESEMVEQWYPNGERPRTAEPVMVPICDEFPGIEPSEGGSFHGPMMLQLYCATQGASIAYTFEDGEDAHWALYTEPIRLPTGTSTIRTRAIRIGYEESDEKVATFEVVES